MKLDHRHPLMHKTPAADHIVLLSGEKRGVGQREPARLVVVMVGGT